MLRRLFLLSLLTLLALPARADTPPEDLRRLLATPGVHAIMRHALAPGTGDPSNFDVTDCTTQRNLDAAGREQSRRIGAALKDLGASFDEIRTSQWCRCEETAQLLDLGLVVPDPAFNSFFQDRSTKDAQTAQVSAFLTALPSDRRVMMVTHQVNITALLDVFPSSGEVFLIQANPSGEIEVVGSFLLPAT